MEIKSETKLSASALDVGTYFEEGNSWYYDRYQQYQLQARKWFIAFLLMSMVSIGLAITLAILLPLKSWVPLPVHINDRTHQIWFDPEAKKLLSLSPAMMKRDLAQYVMRREGYSTFDQRYRRQYLFYNSTPAIYRTYIATQTHQDRMYRSVRINDVILLEQKNEKTGKENLARVDFTTITYKDHHKQEEAWVATIRWAYQGTPKDIAIARENWNGFQVTHYQKDGRTL